MNKIQNIDSKISNNVSLKYYINNFKKIDYALFFFFFLVVFLARKTHD